MKTQQKNPQQNTTVVVMKSNKSTGVAIILALLFGPLGLLYASVKGGIIMFFITSIVALFTLGIGLLITWPACVIWAAVAVNNQNKT